MELKKKKNEAVESHPGPAQSHAEDISANHAPDLEKIRLRAYEIHLERGGLSGNELEDCCKPNVNSRCGAAKSTAISGSR